MVGKLDQPLEPLIGKLEQPLEPSAGTLGATGLETGGPYGFKLKITI